MKKEADKMAKISNELRDFLTNHLAYVATADAKGVPNVVPKGEIAISGEGDYIAFADLYSHQTRNNLRQNPHIAITVVNPASYEGYQLKGKAKVIECGREYDRLSREVSGCGQLNHPNAKYALKVKINKIINIGYGEKADKEI
jgi:predicted pyridoxine 5'-phosphate oxidase superfamily flavin-nucleotide-binding protein